MNKEEMFECFTRFILYLSDNLNSNNKIWEEILPDPA